MELDDVLSDKEPETPVVETPPEKPAEVEVEKPTSRRAEHRKRELEAQGRDPETGKFVSKEEETPVKEEPKVEVKDEVKHPAQEFTEKEKAFLKTAQEERQKRQELERRLAELEKAKPKEEGEKKTFWDDPEGHLKAHEDKLAARERNLTLNVSERLARSKYQDFDEKVAVFAEILQTPAGPGVHAQFLAAPDPAEFAYRLGKQTKELREAGSIDDLKAKLEKELRVKLEAEYKVKQDELEKQRKELPSSLSDVKGATKQSKVVWNGPPPLEDILKP